MAGPQDERRKRHHRMIDILHDRTDVPEGQLQALKELMKADPAYQKPRDLVPLDDISIKTEYALKIQKRIQRYVPGAKDFRLNNVHLAVIWSAPLSTFGDGGTLSARATAVDLHKHLEALAPLVKHFLARWSDAAYTKYSASHPGMPGVPQTIHKATRGSTRESSAKALNKISEQFQQLGLEGSEEDEIEDEEDDIADTTFLFDDKRRNSSAVSACKKRDNNTCVLTGTSDPEVCHIIPFSWNSTQLNIKKTQFVFQASAVLMGAQWTDENSLLLANPDVPGGSDHVWNTICINPLLHKWWAQAFFGLKCLGIIDKDKNTSIVEVQFRWMPRSKKNPTAPCSLTENERKKMEEEIRAFTDGGSLPATPKHGKIGASRINLSCPLLSGHTFHIEMPPEDARRFKDMLDLQWACIVAAALSGAAEAPDLLPDHPGWGGHSGMG
ncbi:hypothetical protein CDV31_015398 [Fusarium ambrosium]|uniref:HNH nuclease domain-containing protein n=1 Tax=Fusarium ambrosium TaxID=131363 RepID=A0A428SPK6_9HYPO|nr:hypothetical protein CDV31_015398 [Fusarium ambrosium]